MALALNLDGLKFGNWKESSSRRMTLAYLAALGLIALLATGMHFLLNHSMVQQEDAATIINIAGRQRMLSQRIALLAQDFDSGIESARKPLKEAIDLMERSQNALVGHNDLGISSELSPAAAEFYFSGDKPLDDAISKFIVSAHQFVVMAPGPLRHQISATLHQTALYDLLPALDHAVSIFESEANDHVASSLLVQKVVFTILLFTLVAEGLFIFKPMVSAIKDHENRLYILATRDGLTKLPNRRFFTDTADRLTALARRSKNQTLSALMIDIDQLKHINDSLGQDTGDAVLKRFGDIVRATLRNTDVFGRIGGDEFAVVLPDTPLDAALLAAERLRLAVEADRFAGNPDFSISIGVTQLMPADVNIDGLLNRSDEAMYFAKSNGRNRIAFLSGVHPEIYDRPSQAGAQIEERKVA